MSNEELSKAIRQLLDASSTIESIQANEALADRIMRLSALIRKGSIACNDNCNCRGFSLEDPSFLRNE